ncbi:MAG TPA: glycosyltransferase [Solirubrobacterales bacterium]|nr:glycosyltransferase [Solirubrobacterales bacterium]
MSKAPKKPPGPSMLAFWEALLEPLIEALGPRRIVEVGSDKGTTTRALLDWAEKHDATVDVIDPKPSFDVEELRRAHPKALVFHGAPSLEVLPNLKGADLALIDGDHNRYTVLNELRLLEQAADAGKALPPVIALHDVGWPYGRRDLYYDPERIPAEERRPFERRGLRPDSDELVDDGINPHLANAKLPAPRHNGVLGGIEDFVAESRRKWTLFEVAGQHGLGVLAAVELLKKKKAVRDLLEATQEADFLRARIEAVERERIEAEIRRGKAERAARAKPKVPAELTEQLDDAERQARKLRRQRDAAEEREAQLEDELVRERRSARSLREEVEAAAERGERSVRRLAELEGAAETARARADEKEAALERAKAARSRLVTDFEESRESLERRIDELRSQADTGRHAASELREALEERGLELQRLEAEMLSLRATLGRAQAETEVARSERSALERRLRELATMHEATLAEIEAPPEVVVAPTRSEREALASFTSEYEPLSPTGTDPLALPSPRDRRGVLVGAARAPGDGRPSVDVVVCVHNALADVRRCLWSLVEKGSYPFHLIVVNDGSDAETTAYLEEAAQLNSDGMTLIHNDTPPHGYTLAANLGMRAAAADYVVVLNSDTIVTFGWLERIVACGESDERIGILGPLSNAASHQSVPELRDAEGWATNPLPVFATEDGLAKLLERLSPRDRPRFPFVNGFCYVVKRPVFEAIGFFDETHFASGYCEENDFSYRAAQAGFELAVADDAYVFHAKSKSYTPEARKPIAKRNYEIFLRKHGAENIQPLVAELESDTSLSPLRGAVAAALAGRDSFADTAIRGGASDPLSIAFILPGLGVGGSGGSHSIYQEAQGLRRLGATARIFLAEHAWERALATYGDAEELFEPFAGIHDLEERTAGADVISATHYKSVALLGELRRRRQDFLPAYYVQDYEPFFTAREDEDLREAQESYEAIPGCLLFAKTHWLCNIVAERHGLPVAKVEPSLDTALFHAEGRRRGEGPLRVAAMVRPRTPRRQPTATCAVLEELRRRFGRAIEIVTFGCPQAELGQVPGSEHHRGSDHRGIIGREEVAELLRASDVFLDMSMYQAFGRTALEAMACGCTAVVPRLGGVWEFLVDGVNGRAVDTSAPGEAVEAIAALVSDRERLEGMQEAACRTAARYSIDRAALSEYLVFAWEQARRLGADRAAV